MKTKDAFAFRKFYDFGFTDAGNINSYEDFERVADFLYTFQTKGFKRENTVAGSLEDIVNAIEVNRYTMRREHFLFSRIENHIRRLTALLSAAAEKLAIGVDSPKLRDMTLRAKKMIEKYQIIRDSIRGGIDSSRLFFQSNIKTLKDAVQVRFGDKLRQARKAAGYTQVKIAEYLNITQISYSQYETGRATPPLSTIWLLARKFKVSADWLLCLKD